MREENLELLEKASPENEATKQDYLISLQPVPSESVSPTTLPH